MRLTFRRRRGFTLVELLVVMSIIAMLAGLLLPAVNSVRETGRKTTCANNIRNLALAMQNHEAQRGMLPGWVVRQDARVMYLSAYDGSKLNPPLTGQRGSSWVFGILPFIEKDDIFRAYSIPKPGDTTKVNANGTVMHAETEPIEHIKILTCPNDTSALNNAQNMSYVCNAGMRDTRATTTGPDNHNDVWTLYREQNSSALFHNAWPSNGTAPRGSLQSASAGDGASATFMLSENMDAGKWTSYAEKDTSFCWPAVAASPATTATAGTATMAPNNGPIGVNEGNLPRASSYHPGGFTVAYADSHVGFMNSNVDWTVYIRLFTPRGDSVTQIPTKENTYPATPTIDTEVMKIQSTPVSETF